MTDQKTKTLLQAHGWEMAPDNWYIKFPSGPEPPETHYFHENYCRELEYISEHLALKILWLHQDRDTQEGEKNKYKVAVDKKEAGLRGYRLQRKQVLQRVGQALNLLKKGEGAKANRILVQCLSTARDVE